MLRINRSTSGLYGSDILCIYTEHFSHALKSGRRGNSLGTVYHLVETCGVELKGDGWKVDWNDYKFSSKLPLPNTFSTRVHDNNISEKSSRFAENFSQKENFDENGLIPKDIEKQNQLQVPASFKPYAWPRFLQRCTDCGETASQADAIWLASISVLGATVAHIGINLLRMMATVAWIRSLDDWLMEETEDTEKSATQRLLACPGIVPDPSVAEENVKDGVISRFRLSITHLPPRHVHHGDSPEGS